MRPLLETAKHLAQFQIRKPTEPIVRQISRLIPKIDEISTNYPHQHCTSQDLMTPFQQQGMARARTSRKRTSALQAASLSDALLVLVVASAVLLVRREAIPARFGARDPYGNQPDRVIEIASCTFMQGLSRSKAVRLRRAIVTFKSFFINI